MNLPPLIRAADYKREINTSISIWEGLLSEYCNIEYAYVKGSAIRPWDSKIDYVPEISDVDIHVKLSSDSKYIAEDIETATAIVQRYEYEFLEQHPDHLHIPRPQLVHLNKMLSHPTFIPSHPENIEDLVGTSEIPPMPDEETIRKVDRDNLLELDMVRKSLPDMLLDRRGFQLWVPLRRLNWRLSPSVVRLLSQYVDSPSMLWGRNRSHIFQQLLLHDLHEIATLFRQYYIQAWKLYETGFTSTKHYLQLFTTIEQLFGTIVEQRDNLPE